MPQKFNRGARPPCHAGLTPWRVFQDATVPLAGQCPPQLPSRRRCVLVGRKILRIPERSRLQCSVSTSGDFTSVFSRGLMDGPYILFPLDQRVEDILPVRGARAVDITCLGLERARPLAIVSASGFIRIFLLMRNVAPSNFDLFT